MNRLGIIEQQTESEALLDLPEEVGVFDLIDEDQPGWAEGLAYGQDIDDHWRSLELRAKHLADVVRIYDDFLKRTEGREVD